MKGFFTALLDWLYPPRCMLCRKLLPLERTERCLCVFCRAQLPWITPPVCQCCGRTVAKEKEFCPRCEENPFFFEKAAAVFLYPQLRKTISHFKREGYRSDAAPLGELMADYLMQYHADWIMQIDAVIPVPLHKSKEKSRGFNQSALLAEELAKRVGLVVWDGLLWRNRKTEPQSSLLAQERHINLQGAFSVRNPEKICKKTLLLVDDIFTTGATANECSRVLKEAGCTRVLVFSLTMAEREIDATKMV